MHDGVYPHSVKIFWFTTILIHLCTSQLNPQPSADYSDYWASAHQDT